VRGTLTLLNSTGGDSAPQSGFSLEIESVERCREDGDEPEEWAVVVAVVVAVAVSRGDGCTAVAVAVA
jgi:hypothetical protein